MVNLDDNRDELLGLKNLGPVTVDMLIDCGIQTKKDMADFGSVNLYHLLWSRGYKLSMVAIYAFEGAILNIHWNKLSPETMSRLKEELATSRWMIYQDYY